MVNFQFQKINKNVKRKNVERIENRTKREIFIFIFLSIIYK